MPNKAMITVTTADSKYSRKTVLGGPIGSASTLDSRLRPLGSTDRDPNAVIVSLDLFSVVVADSVIADIVEARKYRGQAARPCTKSHLEEKLARTITRYRTASGSERNQD